MDNRERIYDQINGDSESYNPYRAQREREEELAESARPKGIGERRDAILCAIARLDSCIARESGIDNTAQIATLRQQLTDLDAEEMTVDGWTVETTTSRRAAWNTLVKSGKLTGRDGKIHAQALRSAEVAQGWTVEDLKKAITYYGL